MKGRGKETVAETEHELVVKIPLVVRIRPIVVEPQAILVTFHIKDVRVTVGVSALCDMPSMPLPV